MDLIVSSEFDKGVSRIFLSGDIDSSSAPKFMKEVEKVSAHKPDKLVFFMEELNFMSSAGLRVLIFAKQKLGADVTIDLVKPQEQIVDLLQKTGFHYSVHIVDSFDE